MQSSLKGPMSPTAECRPHSVISRIHKIKVNMMHELQNENPISSLAQTLCVLTVLFFIHITALCVLVSNDFIKHLAYNYKGLIFNSLV